MLMPDGAELDDRELLSLWERGRSLARRYCADALRRLARGEGGFYDADDLEQDLFLAFCEVVEAWRSQPLPEDEDLWRRWGRYLWGGGIHILRRPPQRLWWRAEWSIDPDAFALEPPQTADSSAKDVWPALSRCREELVDDETAEARTLHLQTLDDLEERLWQLRPLQRQALYGVIIQHHRPAELARQLGMKDAETIHRLIAQARKNLEGLAQAPRRAGRRIGDP